MAVVFLLPCILFGHANGQLITDATAALHVVAKAGKNQSELKRALDYFNRQGDPQKIKAIQFLVANMDIHQSVNYIWVDDSGHKVNYDEMAYPTFDAALAAFEKVKKTVGGIRPKPLVYRDIDTITASLLIENVEEAFRKWKTPYAKHLSFPEFCEYILPYRIGIEPLQQWRTVYAKRFSYFAEYIHKYPLLKTLNIIGPDYNKWFTNTWGKEVFREPLPRLGPLQLLSRAKGNCENISDLETFMFRSQGIPVSSDFVPFWGTSSGTHFFNAVYDHKGHPFLYDPMRIISKDYELVQHIRLDREPGKVIRLTYGKQPGILASKVRIHDIPVGYMRYYNYKDVTEEYWQTKDFSVKILTSASKPVAFANVFNNGKWQPVWWGDVVGGVARFKKMGRGVVYLPTIYRNGKNVFAGYPYALGYNSEMVLKPDLQNRRRIAVAWQRDYLVFRPGKKYALFFWNNGWQHLGVQMAKSGTNILYFDNVPKNALLILIPEYTQHKERPFTISDSGQRSWW